MIGYFITLSKQFFRSWNSLFVFLFPIAMLLGLGNMMPATVIIPSSITISIAAAVLLTFGPNLFELRRTSLMKSMSLTSLSKGKVLATNMFFTSVMAVISITIVMTLSYLLTEVWPFLATDLGLFSEGLAAVKTPVYWPGLDWGALIYASFTTALMTFGLTYLIVALTKTNQALYLSVYIYIFAFVILGGVVLPGFLNAGHWVHQVKWIIPHAYSNGQLTASFANPIDKLLFDIVNNGMLEQLATDVKSAGWAQDVEAVNAWLEALSVNPDAIKPLSILTPDRFEIDWQVVYDETGFVFTGSFSGEFATETMNDLFNGSTLSPGFTDIAATIATAESLVTFNADNIDTVIDTWTSMNNQAAAWDTANYESALNIFMPIVFAGTFAGIGIWRFQWTVR